MVERLLSQQEVAGPTPAVARRSSEKMSLHFCRPALWGRRDVARLPLGSETHVVRSLTASKRRTVDAEIAGSSPAGPPRSILDFRFWILDWRIRRSTFDDLSSIQNP